MQYAVLGPPARFGAAPECSPSGSSQITLSKVLTRALRSSTCVCSSFTRFFISMPCWRSFIVHPIWKRCPFQLSISPNRTLMLDDGISEGSRFREEEPPARIELATSSLPMRCYTAKPRWRDSAHLKGGYNRFVMAKPTKHGFKFTSIR